MSILLIFACLVSLIVGAIIFLVGIGAIVGVAGGILLSSVGVMISLIGVGTMIHTVMGYMEHDFATATTVDMDKKNGRWTA